jgi:putative addiction module CopG family antidote
LTHDLDRFVIKKVRTGRYESASEVVRAGLRTLDREEQQYEAKLAGLRAPIDEGTFFRSVRKNLKLPVSPPLTVATFRFSRRAEADLLNSSIPKGQQF